MSQLFVSYRRSDTEIAAGRLARDLRICFGDDAVFRDKESIGAGADWSEAIRGSLKRQGVALVLIGERWLERASDGSRRIDDPEDVHRREIASALESCHVIPILVGQARMAKEDELPENIRALARRNALKLQDDEWEDYDFPRLAEEIVRCGFKRIDTGLERIDLRAVAALGLGVAALIAYDVGSGEGIQALAVAAMGILAILLAAWSWFASKRHRPHNVGLAVGAIVVGALAVFAAASG